jgi:hypothetical protein
MVSCMFGKPAVEVVCRANVKLAGSLTLEDVKKGGHGGNGRPVGTRTPDLYRVKGRLANRFLPRQSAVDGYIQTEDARVLTTKMETILL